MKKQISRWLAFVLLLVLLLGLFAASLKEMRPEKRKVVIPEYEPWSEEVLDFAAILPVQEGGRVKPLETRAGFAMLQIHGDRRINIEGAEGEKVVIRPMAWMLDLLFRPELAHQLPSFRIDNSEVLKALGLEIDDRKKRDRYSYNELEPYLSSMMQKAGDYQALKERGSDLSPLESQTISLASAMNIYFYLSHYFDFVREGVVLRVSEGEGKQVAMSTVMASSRDLVDAIRRSSQQGGGIPPHVAELLTQIEKSAQTSKFSFHPLPPIDSESVKWNSVGELIEGTLTGQVKNPVVAVKDVQQLEKLYDAFAQGQDEFLVSLKEFRSYVLARAGEDAEKKVAMEHSFIRMQWYKRGLFCFAIGGLFLLGTLFAPNHSVGKYSRFAIWIFTSLGLFLILGGIVHRYLVVERPPVTNLYETIPFITAGMVLLFILVERMTRARIALAIAPVVGLGGMVLAMVFEVAAASDSLDPLVAVLRSNFWLTTHVLIITYGYAAGLAGAALGFVYIFMRVLGLDAQDKKIRRQLTRMTYGVTCFTLLLSLIGTVLGGIWANDSWGRFWGWDPKENGALMIVLWSLFILHGRAAGLLREWGINIAAAFGGIVVTFSWFHVNMLGTGLHSYGFTDGKSVIWVFYGAALFVILVGMAYSQWAGSSSTKKKEEELTNLPTAEVEPSE